MPLGRTSDFVVKEGSHVAVGDYKPLKDDFRPTGGVVQPAHQGEQRPVPVPAHGNNVTGPTPPRPSTE